MSQMPKETAKDHTQERLAKLSDAVKTILECVGEDPGREGLINTPMRYAKAMLFFTKGYQQNYNTLTNSALFNEDVDVVVEGDREVMVIAKEIGFHSLCEHHLGSFSGKVHVGYVPNTKIIGLSKVVRVVEMFSQRLQVQERLTKDILRSLSEVLQPRGVAVIVEARHLCMAMRGVRNGGAVTSTSQLHLQSVRSARERSSEPD